MKKQTLSNFLAFTALCVFTGCVGTNNAGTSADNIAASTVRVVRNFASFSDVVGEELKLAEVYVESTFSREIIFDRDELINEGVGDILTLNFDREMISGTGSPNRYSAPYTLGQGQAISIMPMRSTLMASILQQPEKLPEHQFFSYMQNVYEWRIRSGNLELLSRTEEGQEVRLVFE